MSNSVKPIKISGAAQVAQEAAEKRLRLHTLGPSIKQIKAKAAERMMSLEATDARSKAKPATLPTEWKSVRDILDLNPLPGDIDPFTRTLLGGLDPLAAHQAVTLMAPIMAFLGQNARVIYNDDTLRWVSGQSWQMGGSGCGKSLVLRTLEELFLSKELLENEKNAKAAAAYSLRSEKEKKETPMPENEIRVMDSVPTALALLQQIQINRGGAIYISCSEAGEFGKKIGNSYYSIVLDMLKKSYDGTGEPFLHKSSAATYYTPSMKLCLNVGGTVDPMYRILRHCNADGTLSRGNLTILPERKDEETDGKYKSPSWSLEQRSFLRECGDRLRMFNNVYHENEKPDEIDECNALLEKYGLRKEGAPVPTVQDLEDCVRCERRARAICIPEVLELGRDIKAYLSSLGDMAADCCSRADERAMGLCYLLLIANGFAPLRRGGNEAHSEEARTPEDRQLLRQCIGVARWWVMITIDCAMAVQTRLEANSRSERDGILAAFGEVAAQRRTKDRYVQAAREAAISEFEESHRGREVTVKSLREIPMLSKAGHSLLYELLGKRQWTRVGRGVYLIPQKEGDATS